MPQYLVHLLLIISFPVIHLTPIKLMTAFLISRTFSCPDFFQFPLFCVKLLLELFSATATPGRVIFQLSGLSLFKTSPFSIFPSIAPISGEEFLFHWVFSSECYFC